MNSRIFPAIVLIFAAAILISGCGKSGHSGPVTLTVVVKDALDDSPVANVSITLESTHETNLTDVNGTATFDNAFAPYTLTLEAPGQSPMTIYGATGKTVELLASVKPVPKHTALITVTGLNDTSFPPGMGDTGGTILSSGLTAFGGDFAGGLGNYSVSGTSSVPSPIPVEVDADKKIIIGTLVDSELGYPLKYGYTLVSGGITTDCQAATVAAESLILNPPALFSGTLDFSAMDSINPGSGFMAAFADVPGYEPWVCGFGQVDAGGAAYDGTIIDIPEANGNMAVFLVEDNSTSAASVVIVRGPKSDFGSGTWDIAVKFMDAPQLATPASDALVNPASPVFSWTNPQSGVYVMISITGPSGFDWTGLVVDGRTSVELPPSVVLASGVPYTWSVTAAVIPNFKLSGFSLSKLWDTVTKVSMSEERIFTAE
jgi:hypothetical protein